MIRSAGAGAGVSGAATRSPPQPSAREALGAAHLLPDAAQATSGSVGRPTGAADGDAATWRLCVGPALHVWRIALPLRWPWLNHSSTSPAPAPALPVLKPAARAMFSCASSPRRSRPSSTGSAPPRGTIQRARSGGLRRSHSSAKQLCDADDQHENMYTDKSPRPGGGDGREALSPLAVNSPDTMPLSESVVRTAAPANCARAGEKPS